MAGDAYDTIRKFWEIQDHGDYSALVPLFADDAQLVDPIYGTFVGREAIHGFMSEMNVKVKEVGGVFRLVEMDGDDHTAWAQWEFTVRGGTSPREGVGVYRVENGQLTYYRDYMNP